MLTIHVHTAAEREHPAVIDVITLAFATDPMARWSYQDPATYLSAMPATLRAFAGNSFAHDAAHLVEGGHAAAIWLPPGVHQDFESLAAITEEHVTGPRLDEMSQVFEQMSTYHPQEPCWYLPFIGVDPIMQGRGFGSALLQYGLEQCDRDGVPVYLESSNARNILLYQRHGFEILGSIRAGSSPTVVPMLRRRR